MAGGRFAPGHLGELTQCIPFEMVDEALKATGRVQERLRDAPSRSTRHEGPVSTGPATRPPPASRSSQPQALDDTAQPQASRPCN
nr:transposase domain-containing protein [Streptomyces spongiicola]